MFKYSMQLSWSDEDDCYIAVVPEFPGLMAHGDTAEEAASAARAAAEGFIEVYQEDGDPIPEPATAKEYSGNLRVRMPKSLHQKLAAEANIDGVSLNAHIVHMLAEKTSIAQTAQAVVKETRRFLLSEDIFRGLHQTEVSLGAGTLECSPYGSVAVSTMQRGWAS